MRREMGNELKEARGDVQEAIDMGEFASELADRRRFTWREPVGAAGQKAQIDMPE